MPELPEVQTVVTTLTPLAVGRRIERIKLLRPEIVEPAGFALGPALRGRRIESIERRGKRIIFRLDDANACFIHLGMTGRLSVEAATAPRPIHTHLLVWLDDGNQLRFRDPRRFGGFKWIGRGAPDAGLGPEPLTITPKELHSRLKRTHRAIKAALLDQALIAGLGNIYVDEALFAAGIHPARLADKLARPQTDRLTEAIKQVLNRAIHHRGSTLRDYRDANGNAGDFQRLHQVYGRAGKPCATCATKLLKTTLAGRGTHFCPKCQKAPRR